MAVEKPVIIENNPEAILQQIAESYTVVTGKIIYPAQVEQLIFDAFTYRESTVRQAGNDAGLQMLVAFSEEPIIDYLAQLVGVYRLDAGPARCRLRFNLEANPAGVTIPAGLRVQSIDGRVIFETIDELNIPSGTLEGAVFADCSTDGIVGNGYAPTQINAILDPLAFVVVAANIETTAGGSDRETTENLRERIVLAPSAFSTAGSEGAYKFWARTANPSIIDVGVYSNVPGTVQLYPLMNDGSVTPTQVLDQVLAVCSDKKVRPLTDTVTAIAPTKIGYELHVNLTLYIDADQPAVEAQVLANLQAFTLKKRLKMNLDIVLAQVIKECTIDGVYDVEIEDENGDPFETIVVAETEFAFCDLIDVQTVDTTEG